MSFISRYYRKSYIVTNDLIDFKHNVTIAALPFLIFGKSEKSITLSRNSKYWFINRLLILSLNVKVKISSPVALVNHLLYPPEFFITLFQLSLSIKIFKMNLITISDYTSVYTSYHWFVRHTLMFHHNRGCRYFSWVRKRRV